MDDDTHSSVLAHHAQEIQTASPNRLDSASGPRALIGCKWAAHGAVDGVPLRADPCHPAAEIYFFGYLRNCVVRRFSCAGGSPCEERRYDAHTRYMAGTVLFALEPALERVFVFYVPGVSGFASALYFALISMEVILVILLFFEWRRNKVRAPFVIALGFL